MPEIKDLVSGIAEQYPQALRETQRDDIARIVWHLECVRAKTPPQGTVMDVGGGIGLMSICVAALGFRSILVDDFDDEVNAAVSLEDLGLHAKYGVEVISGDARLLPAPKPGSIDTVMSFESIEHWHHSPRPVFHRLVDGLRPGGFFFLGVPNCVDIRKRLSVPFGYGSWSPIEEWYDKPVFRGHVRELDVRDLRHIAKDLGLERQTIVGRAWQAYGNRRTLVRTSAPLIDAILRNAPSLCSDIYLMAHKTDDAAK